MNSGNGCTLPLFDKFLATGHESLTLNNITGDFHDCSHL